MLTYEDALTRVLVAVSSRLPAEEIVLDAAFGRALAQDIVSDADLPPFDNSAVDGYALNLQEATNVEGKIFPVTQSISAGEAPSKPLYSGEAARIFTGAPLPDGADAIIMQEDAEVKEEGRAVLFHVPGSAAFIRRAGSDVRRGEIILSAGAAINAGAIGLLASLNKSCVSVVARPRVALLTTGDELIPVSHAPLAPGQIRNSNDPLLAAALMQAGADIVLRRHVPDDLAATEQSLIACLAAGAKVIVTSGGVSVGERDFVRDAVEAQGVLDFWRIAIKPGKPLAFGKIGDALFFGLPGNPASSLVTFELFVRPVLRKMAGFTGVTRSQVSATLTEPLEHAPGRRDFVRARVTWEDNGYVAAVNGTQGSHRQMSLVGMNALLIADENRGDYAAGETLPALLLDF